MMQATLTPNGAAGNQTITKYTYDPNGIRRSSEVTEKLAGANPSVTKTKTEFLIDTNQAYAQVLEDWTAKAALAGTTDPDLPTASLQNTYVYGDDLLAEARYAVIDANGTPTNVTSGNDAQARIGSTTGLSSYHYDGLGSTRLLSAINIDQNGNPITSGTAQSQANETITDQYAYTAFGEADQANSSGTTENNYRYTGEQLDPNLGFYYLRARYMNPNQGRFVGMDSWMGSGNDPITLHKYLFANADPVRMTDPSGNMSLLEVAVSAGIVLTAGNAFAGLKDDVVDEVRGLGTYDTTMYLYSGGVPLWINKHVKIRKYGNHHDIDISGQVSVGPDSGFTMEFAKAFIANVTMLWAQSVVSPGGNSYTMSLDLSPVETPSVSVMGTLNLNRSRYMYNGSCRAHGERAEISGGDDIYLCENASAGTMAHEFGHSLGFGDTYVERTMRPLAHHEDDIMARSQVGRVHWYHYKALVAFLGVDK